MHYLAVGGAKVENIHLLHVIVMNKDRSLRPHQGCEYFFGQHHRSRQTAPHCLALVVERRIVWVVGHKDSKRVS